MPLAVSSNLTPATLPTARQNFRLGLFYSLFVTKEPKEPWSTLLGLVLPCGRSLKTKELRLVLTNGLFLTKELRACLAVCRLSGGRVAMLTPNEMTMA